MGLSIFIKIEQCGSNSLLGSIINYFRDHNLSINSDIEECRLYIQNIMDNVNIMEDIDNCKKYFPKSKIKIYSYNTYNSHIKLYYK